MNSIKGVCRRCAVFGAVVASVSVSYAQNQPQFTGVTATVENAILLYWASNPNDIYEIDYADQLNGNADGTTAWAPLYTGYPSHGSNTFIADAGNYDTQPQVPHPKYLPMRFYRL